MSEMSNQNSENNGVNRAGPVGEDSLPGRCSLVPQRGRLRHPTTVRLKWSKNVKKIIMECFFRSKPFDNDGKPIRGYRNGKNMESLKSSSNDCVTKQELLGKMAGSLI